jgi:ADP-heptose:LPS heptosyltransferase
MSERYRNILAIKLREIGDAVIWTSALQSLRGAYPDAKLDVLVRDFAEPVLREVSWIDRIHTVSGRGTVMLARSLLSLRRQRYDLALGFHATNTLCNLIPLLGAPDRALYQHKREGDQRFSTLGVPDPGRYEDAILRDHRLLRAVGIDVRPPPTRLVISDREASSARDRLGRHFPELGSDDFKLLGLLPGGSSYMKRYPRDLWLRVLDQIVAEQRPVAVFVDRALSEEWRLRDVCEERDVPLFDDLGLRELMGVLSCTEVVISNDLGPKHIAVALGAKSVTVFGPTEVGEWHPYDRASHPVMRVEVPCRDGGPQELEPFRKCSISNCDHLSCLRGVDPEEVWSVARGLLDG